MLVSQVQKLTAELTKAPVRQQQQEEVQQQLQELDISLREVCSTAIFILIEWKRKA